jgi:hypothetical protein
VKPGGARKNKSEPRGARRSKEEPVGRRCVLLCQNGLSPMATSRRNWALIKTRWGGDVAFFAEMD